VSVSAAGSGALWHAAADDLADSMFHSTLPPIVLVCLCLCLQLAAELSGKLQQPSEEGTWVDRVARKKEEFLETPMLEEAKARTKLDKHTEKVGCCLRWLGCML
jgi:hypothetical protein